jgi:hypothetical protein
MEKTKLNHAHPKILEAKHIEEARQLTYQERFEKLIALIEVSNMFKNAKIIKTIKPLK